MTHIIFLISLILIIWFKTNAPIIYAKLFRVKKFFDINDWEEFKKTQDCTITFHQYLRMKNPNGFFTQLITCPICLSVWMSLFFSFYIGLYCFPIICVSSIFIYYLITRLMN